jgi:hypothetical protein
VLLITQAGKSTRDLFEPGSVVRIGRGPANDVIVGDTQLEGAWTVSAHHIEIQWDSGRWTTTNVSSRFGLLHVYEPGWEATLLEPGRSWAPNRGRWSYGLGRPGQLFQVVCTSNDHMNPPSSVETVATSEDITAILPVIASPVFTLFEQQVLFAYYGDFARLPRPAVMEPASHQRAAQLVGRSTDSARKAIERINEKISRSNDPPWAATGRNVSSEIGRWLARTGALDPVDFEDPELPASS